MPYSEDSPFKDEVIRIMAGSACYAQTAISAGNIWDFATLEEIIDGKEYPSQSGKYRRMLNGIIPGDSSILKIHDHVQDENCDLFHWRDHAIWPLLSLNPLTAQDIETALLSVTGKIREEVFDYFELDDEPTDYRLPRFKPDKESIQRIANYKNLDALLILIAYSREADASGVLQTYAVAAHHCLKIFPVVLVHYPQLYIRRKLLTDRLNELIWKPDGNYLVEPYINTSLPKLSIKMRPLVKAALKEGFSFPPERILRKYK